MGKCIDIRRDAPEKSSIDILTSILRAGAQKMLQQAIEEEINAYISSVNGPAGETTIIRNGYLPERTIQSGIGDVKVRQKKPLIIRQTHGGLKEYKSKDPPAWIAWS